MRNPGITVVALGITLAAVPARAQCTIDSAQPAGLVVVAAPDAPLGQSFVACQDGIVTNVAVPIAWAVHEQIRLGLQHGTDLLAPEYTQVGLFVQGSRRIRWVTSFPVSAGQAYSLSVTPLDGALGLANAPGSAIPDGTMLAVVGGVTTGRSDDLQVTITVSPEPIVPARPATWGGLKFVYR